jgi:Family of unknown function (DUF7010)
MAMPSPQTDPAAGRRVVASVIGGAGGTAYVVINASALDTAASTVLRILAIGALLWILANAWRLRRNQGGARSARQGFGPAYWGIVAVEAALIFGGRAVIVGLLGLPDDFLPWLSLVVGLHFFAFVVLWRQRVYLWLGLLITASALAAFVLVDLGASAPAVAVFSGILPGLALLAFSLTVTRISGGRSSTPTDQDPEAQPGRHRVLDHKPRS